MSRNGRIDGRRARMAELVDAVDSKSTALTGVRVRLSLRAPNGIKGLRLVGRSPFFLIRLAGVHIGVHGSFTGSPFHLSKFLLCHEVVSLEGTHGFVS